MAEKTPEVHPGLPLPGYQPQSRENLDLVAEGKYIEEIVLRYLDQLEDLAYVTHYVSVEKPGVPGVVAQGEKRLTGHVDPRFLAMARTDIQKGFMVAYRSIMQPTRTPIPSEFNFDHLINRD